MIIINGRKGTTINSLVPLTAGRNAGAPHPPFFLLTGHTGWWVVDVTLRPPNKARGFVGWDTEALVF